MSETLHKGLPVYSFQTTHELEDWFSRNYLREEGFWLRYFKKATNKPSIKHDEAVDEALCWGWIDGLINKFDEESYVVRFTPRRTKSVWSKVNVAKVERLVEEGRMRPSGLKHVDAAKKDGRWDAAYAGQASITVPDEFLAMIKKEHGVWEFYESLNKANKYAIAYRIAVAIGDEKKSKIMEKILLMLKSRKAFHEN